MNYCFDRVASLTNSADGFKEFAKVFEVCRALKC